MAVDAPPPLRLTRREVRIIARWHGRMHAPPRPAVSFLGTFLVIPQFKSSFKEDVDWWAAGAGPWGGTPSHSSGTPHA